MNTLNQNNKIIIEGARENNLQAINLSIPKEKLVVITGISGSGKSSLVHDIIYKEAQRIFAESMSVDSRRLLKSYGQAKVEKISGLAPVVAVSQRTISHHAGSTVGTMSGVYDLLRLLMARFGKSRITISPLKQQRRLFSFNTPYGACTQCHGIGMEEHINPRLIIKDPKLSLRQGALQITTPSGYTVYSQVTIDVMNQVCNAEGFDVDTPWDKLSEQNKNIIWYGSNKIKIPFGKHSLESRMKWTGITAKPRENGYYRGIIPIMEEILKRDRNANILRFVSAESCSVCHGARLNKAALSFYFGSKNMADFQQMNIAEINSFFTDASKDTKDKALYSIEKQIIKSTNILLDLGLSYLQINRIAATLSAGESQRIRLATMAQSSLSGLLYIFDEPSVGLHSADLIPLKKLMRQLVNKGNTVLLIEHENEMIRIADWIIDIGPKAGINGGKLLFNGTYDDFISTEIKNSLSWKYLNKTVITNYKPTASTISPHYFSLHNIDTNNLKNIDVHFLLQAINIVCGVSGSGKSSLVFDCLARDFKRSQRRYIQENALLPTTIISIDQSPIGRTPRSNPATYTKVFDKIRALYAKLESSKNKKLKSSHFSFNVKGGRCEECQGAGYNVVGMHFIGNVEIPCESCHGNRFQEKILNIKYKGKNIKEVLDMSITEAIDFFSDHQDIQSILYSIDELGLGYITLGQRATTLSGGEAQRIKLAAEMSRKTKSPTLYLLDEPTTGLHSYDVEILIKAIRKLKSKGHTIIIIEHHEDIITSGDHIIELGPQSGNLGGNVVVEGTQQQFLRQDSLSSLAVRHLLPNEDYSNQQTQTKHKESIHFSGVKTHNLKNISIDIPRNKFIIFTGVSGSGKSSLAFDTIYSTGRQVYSETLPNYIRSRINNNTEADFQNYSGLTACLSIEQKKGKASLRSTIGTYSGLHDLYRLLFSRISYNKQKQPCNEESGFFSFNKQESACQECKGLGKITIANEEAIISDYSKSIYEPTISNEKIARFYLNTNGQYHWILKALDQLLSLNLERPWRELNEDTKNIILYGTPDYQLDVNWEFTRKGRSGSHHFISHWEGLIPLINKEYQRKHNDHRAANFTSIMKQVECPSCLGTRYKPTVLSYTIHTTNIAEISQLSIKETLNLLKVWRETFTEREKKISHSILLELQEKLLLLSKLELGYLSSSRSIESLSGGEMQRISLASNLNNKMSGITYIFDEPSRALHPKNSLNIIQQLQHLTKNLNTVIAVEHNPLFIKNADLVYEFGPGSGKEGGNIIQQKKSSDFKFSFTKIKRDSCKIFTNKKKISIVSASANNLKDINLNIPTNSIVGICGVSGSGKTSLLDRVIYQSAHYAKAIQCESIDGLQYFDQCIRIDAQDASINQSQNIASYLGLYDEIKRVMASEPKAKIENKRASFFSNTSKEGKCPNCNGLGSLSVKMDFLSDIVETCPECNGSGFNNLVLNYYHQGKNIAEILDLTIQEAVIFFNTNTRLAPKLELLLSMGLSYLTLGQHVKELSLGEKQRIKLVKYLVINNNSRTLFLLDEPSKGLSNNDIQLIFNIFNKLIKKDHTIIMVEHHPQVLQACHYIIELGSGAGEQGGNIIAQGSPEEIITNPKSIMAPFLK